MSFSVVILAAGRGVRMRGTLPKVLYPVGGIPILTRIVETVLALSPHKLMVVCGHQADRLKEALKDKKEITWILQEKQLGTGHAVQQAMPAFGNVDKVLIINGDIPLISQDTLKKILETSLKSDTVFLTTRTDAPEGLGRILRDKQGKVSGIVEEKDATPEQKQINEICVGAYSFSTQKLLQWLPLLETNNAQQEFYITDLIKAAVQEGSEIKTVDIPANKSYEALGINDKYQLAIVERQFQQSQAIELMKQGLMLRDPARFDLRGTLVFGEEVDIDINVLLEGKIKIGNNVSIGANVILKNAEIHDGTRIFPNSIIEDAKIGPGCQIGPFARIRPGSELAVNAHIGNFVEIKQSKIGPKSKINHLSYIGDTLIGEGCNVGAGTITCNYDGKNKHQTFIGDHVFIGSDTQLIAPVKIGNGAIIGAGTTVVRDVQQNELIHNRITHRSIIKPDLEE